MPSLSILWHLMKTLTVEPVILMIFIAESSRGTVMQQLLQDKICSNEYHMDADQCYSMATSASSPEKEKILSLSATSSAQKEMIALLPHILLTMFAASWCDLFPYGRRFVILFSASCQLIETIFLLLNAIFYESNYRLIILNGVPSSLLGSGYMMASFSYVSAVAPNSEKPVRFLIIEIFMGIGFAIGSFVTAKLISMRTSFFFPDSPAIRNYADLCVMGIFLLSATLIWTYFRIGAVPCPRLVPETMSETVISTDTHEENPDSGIQESDETNGRNETTEDEVVIVNGSSSVSCIRSIIDLLRTAFSLRSIVHVYRTVSKRRPNDVHLICWIAMVSHFALYFPLNALDSLYLPLVAKMYRWDSSTFSRAMAVVIVTIPIIISIYTEFIVRKFKFTPFTIMINGMTSTTLKYLSFGSIPSPAGFWGQIIVGCLDGTALSGIRSYLSMKIPANEVTSFFCFLQTVEAAQPFLASAVSSYVFSLTVHSYPTCAVHVSVVPLIVCLAVVCYTDIKVRNRRSGANKDNNQDSASESPAAVYA